MKWEIIYVCVVICDDVSHVELSYWISRACNTSLYFCLPFAGIFCPQNL